MMLSAPLVMSRCFPSGVFTMTDMRLRVLLKAMVVSTLYVCGFPFTSIVTSPGPRPVCEPTTCVCVCEHAGGAERL